MEEEELGRRNVFFKNRLSYENSGMALIKPWNAAGSDASLCGRLAQPMRASRSEAVTLDKPVEHLFVETPWWFDG